MSTWVVCLIDGVMTAKVFSSVIHESFAHHMMHLDGLGVPFIILQYPTDEEPVMQGFDRLGDNYNTLRDNG